jgi:hypothetical protein
VFSLNASQVKNPVNPDWRYLSRNKWYKEQPILAGTPSINGFGALSLNVFRCTSIYFSNQPQNEIWQVHFKILLCPDGDPVQPIDQPSVGIFYTHDF